MTKLVSIKSAIHGTDRGNGYYGVEVQMDGWGYADSISVGASPEDVARFFRGLADQALSQSRHEPTAPEPLTLLLREVLKTTAKMRNMCPPEAFAKIDPLLHRIAAAIDSKPGAGSNEPPALSALDYVLQNCIIVSYGSFAQRREPPSFGYGGWNAPLPFPEHLQSTLDEALKRAVNRGDEHA